MGISQVALRRWAEAHAEIAKALEIDAEAADFLIEEAVFNKALAGDAKAIEFWLKYRNAGSNHGSLGSLGSFDSSSAQGGVDYVGLASLINEP
jgi:hypothetical protein